MQNKILFEEAISLNPLVCNDGGSFIYTNYYLNAHGLDNITKEQFKAIAKAIRQRNNCLIDNPHLDNRIREKPTEYYQSDIFDFMNNSDELKKITEYIKGDLKRLEYPPSRIKKSIRGVSIDTVKLFLCNPHLYLANPILKKIKVTTPQSTATALTEGVLYDEVTTND